MEEVWRWIAVAIATPSVGGLIAWIKSKASKADVDNVYESIMQRQEQSDERIMASLEKQDDKMDTIITKVHNTEIKVAKLEAKQ